MQDARIYKSNSLVEASYRLSLYEQRIILVCISQVRRDQSLTDQQLYTVSAQEIAAMTGTSLGTAYQNLRTASERLFERRVTLYPSKKKSQGVSLEKPRITRWIQTIEYRENQGSVALRFSTDMIPYLSQLSEQFTKYSLTDVVRMTSSHAIRLYELLVQWKVTGTREVEIEWLRQVLQLEDRYPNIRDLKRWVIQPSVEQINEYSPFWVKWDQRKTGRRVSHFIFTFGEKSDKGSVSADKRRKPKRTEPTNSNSRGAIYGIPYQLIEKEARPGEGYEDAALRILQESRKRK